MDSGVMIRSRIDMRSGDLTFSVKRFNRIS